MGVRLPLLLASKKHDPPSFHHTGSTLSKNQKGFVSCVSLQFGIPITSEDKAVFYIRGVPILFR